MNLPLGPRGTLVEEIAKQKEPFPLAVPALFQIKSSIYLQINYSKQEYLHLEEINVYL